MMLTALLSLQGAHWRTRQCGFKGELLAQRITRFCFASPIMVRRSYW
jgi:hypothetical protein